MRTLGYFSTNPVGPPHEVFYIFYDNHVHQSQAHKPALCRPLHIHLSPQGSMVTMLSALLVSIALGALAGATELFDRNLAYASPFTNAIHVRVLSACFV